MFQELMPLIKSRPLMITVASEGDSKVRVNVIPKPIDKDKAPNNKIGGVHSKEVAPIPDEAVTGLTTPLCITGTPEEVDAGLTEALTKFTSAHVTLQQSFDTAATTIADAVKAIDERERLKKEKDKANNKKTTTAKPDDSKKSDPGLPSLFTAQPPAPAAVSANDVTKPGPATDQEEQDEEEDEETER